MLLGTTAGTAVNLLSPPVNWSLLPDMKSKNSLYISSSAAAL